MTHLLGHRRQNKKQLVTYHSKWANALALYASFNWGVRVERLNPPFFLASKGDKKMVFQAMILDTYKGEISIDLAVESDFLILVFADKPGNNLILLDSNEVKELLSRPFNIQEIVPHIKAKDQLEVTRWEDQSTFAM